MRAENKIRAAFVMAIALGVISGCDVGQDECYAQQAAGLTAEGAMFTVLSVNIGNPDQSDPNYALRIKVKRYEDFLGQRIRQIGPDIVALQEVLPPTVCNSFEETDRRHTCFQSDEEAPVRRLLGDEYSIVCDTRRHIECVGVHVAFGSIRGVVPGAFDLNGAQTFELPLPPCEFGDCRGDGDRCDGESAISRLVVETDRGPINVVHAHPAAVGSRCRQLQLEQAFSAAGAMDTVLLGDWNFDPERLEHVVETSIWNRFVGPHRRFADHTLRDSSCEAQPTRSISNISIDRVVSDFAEGTCIVMSDPAIDEGFDFDSAPAVVGLDHYALRCPLTFSR